LMPREVVLGARAGDRVQVLDGLTAGETIVASANFLVDAESRLANTGGGMPGMQHGDGVPPKTPRDTAPPMPGMQHDSGGRMPETRTESPPPMTGHRHD